jgi:integrase
VSKQHGNGEGSIYQQGSRSGRKDGRWVAAIKTDTGQRMVLYGKTRAEVADKLTRALHAREQGTLVRGRRLTLEQFLTSWLRDTVKPTVRSSTYRSYEGLMRTHVISRLGKVTLEKLTPQHVQQLLNATVSTGKSAGRARVGTTAGHIRRVLGTALNRAVEERLVARNVASIAKLPKTTKYQPHPLSADEAQTFLKAIVGDRLEALYVVALATALRQGELLGLTWDDVDLEHGVLQLRMQIQRVDGRLARVELKSEASRGTATLTADAVEALKSHEAQQRLEKLAERKRWADTGLVFTTRIGTPLEGTNVTKAFQRILRDAGIPQRRFHDLRHTTPTLMRKQGVDMKVLQVVMRHSSYKLTADTYGHVLPELQRDAAEKLQAVLHR